MEDRMRGIEFLKAVQLPAAVAFVLAALEAVLYLNGIGWWSVEFCVLAGSLLASVVVLLFLLISIIRRRWPLTLRLAVYAVALGGTPFLMMASAEYAQVARFYLHRDAFEKRVEALPKGSRLIAFSWCAGDECGRNYRMVVFDERHRIPKLESNAVKDRAWIRQASQDPLLNDCVRDPQHLFEVRQRQLSGHFYLVTCDIYYGP
jgi:hypothetical protein